MSCSGGEGGGPVAQNPSVAVSTSAFGPNQTCPNGGINVQSGIDDNGDGVLDPAEVDVVQEVCNGADGLNSLIQVTPEPAGANCSSGGQRIDAGVDINNNAILDIAEITSTEYVCDGAGGADGLNALIKVTPEPAGANCADGGQKIEAGVDSNGNSVLDAVEVTSTEYVCNGASDLTIPIITGVSPEEAKQGQEIRITGIGFGLTQGTSTLTIGGVEALSTDIVSWGEYEIRSTVPSGAGTGIVVLTVGGAQGNPGFFVLLWTNENPVNTAICTAANDQQFIQVVSDGAGGAIIVWEDYRSGTKNDIYAQRVDASGNALWTADGVAVSTAAVSQYAHQIASDGSGGAIVVWEDYRSGTNYDVYAQRVDASGNVMWTTNDVAITTSAGNQYFPQLVSDGSGGAIIAWMDVRSGTYDIYAQRVDDSGNVLWITNDIAITTAADGQYYPQIAPDGLGGAIISWSDYRSGNYDIYAQRVDASGNTLWITDGVAISTAADNQQYHWIIPDEAGGAIIAWTDSRSGTGSDIYAQRMDASGNTLWTTDGVAISTAAGGQLLPRIAPDNAGGAIIVWQDRRSGTRYDIYAQRVDSLGNNLWIADGVAISTVYYQEFPEIVTDGAGGAIIVWQDHRSGFHNDIYAQRVDASGNVLWATNGIAVATTAYDQNDPIIAPDGAGGAIIAWDDYRSGTNYDIYAQGISASGRQ